MMGDDIPTMCVIRGFLGGRQIVERRIQVRSQNEAWAIAAMYFGGEAPYSECDRYTVDTYYRFY